MRKRSFKKAEVASKGTSDANTKMAIGDSGVTKTKCQRSQGECAPEFSRKSLNDERKTKTRLETFIELFPEQPPIFVAAKSGDAERLKNLLSEGCNYTKKNQAEQSPLYLAIENGNVECVRLLLAAAAKDIPPSELHNRFWSFWSRLSHPFELSSNPISLAVRNGHSELVEMLISFSLAWNLGVGDEILHESCESDYIECIRIIINKLPKSVNSTNLGDDTPLHLAANKGNLDAVKALTDAGSMVNPKPNNMGRIPLHNASQRGHGEIVKLLIEKGSDANVRDTREKQTPLIMAAKFGHLNAVRVLLASGADLTMTYNTDLSCIGEPIAPLAEAARWGYMEIVKELADITPREYRSSAIAFAAKNSKNECLKYLFKNGYQTFSKDEKRSKHFFDSVWISLLCPREPEGDYDSDDDADFYGMFVSWMPDGGPVHIDDGHRNSGENSSEEQIETVLNDPEAGDDDISEIDGIPETIRLLLDNETDFPLSWSRDFCRRHISVLKTLLEYGFMELGLGCMTSPNLEDFLELLDSFIVHCRERAVKDTLSKVKLFLKYCPFVKLPSISLIYPKYRGSELRNSCLATLPKLKEICKWNIRCNVIRKCGVILRKHVSALLLPKALIRFVASH